MQNTLGRAVASIFLSSLADCGVEILSISLVLLTKQIFGIRTVNTGWFCTMHLSESRGDRDANGHGPGDSDSECQNR